MFQLQKDIWNEEKAKPKATVLAGIRERMAVKSLNDVRFKKMSGRLIIYGHSRQSPIKLFKCHSNRFTLNEIASAEDGSTKLPCVDEESISASFTDAFADTCSDESFIGLLYLDRSVDNTPFPAECDEESVEINDERHNHSCVSNATEIDENIEKYTTSILSYSVSEDNDNDNHGLASSEMEENNADKNNVSVESFTNTGWGIESAYNLLYADAHLEPPSDEIQRISDFEFPDVSDLHLSSSYGDTENNGLENNYDMQKYSNFASYDTIDELPSFGGANLILPTTSNDQGYQSGNNNIQISAPTAPDKRKEVEAILFALQNNAVILKKEKWNDTDKMLLGEYLNDENIISKKMTKQELLVSLEAIKNLSDRPFVFKKSWNKDLLVKCLVSAMKNGAHVVDTESRKTKCKKKSPSKLSKLTFDVVKKFSKEALTSVMCEDKWEEKCNSWKTRSPNNFLVLDENENTSTEIVWFSQPLWDDSGKHIFHYTDCSHILTCLRTKICTSGITGLRRQAWIDAAKSGHTALNIGIVVECIDKQSVPFAKRVFGEDVENFLVSNNYQKEAKFTRLIRRWYEAEDDPGISAKERISRRLDLRLYLLQNVNFGSFPPKTQYIGGIPIVTFEALLVHIERKLQIYKHLPSKGYNARALGTQEVEQFFSSLRDLDPSGLGTPKPDDIPMMMAKAAFLDNIRYNPKRGFFMTTTRAAVYPEPVYANPEESLSSDENPDETISDSDRITEDEVNAASQGRRNSKIIDNAVSKSGKQEQQDQIPVRDNFFDTSARKRVKGKQKSGLVSPPDCPPKRQRGVRQHHVTDESKILKHTRYNMEDI